MQNFKYFKTIENGFVFFSTKDKIYTVFCIIFVILGVAFNFYYSNAFLGEYAILYRIMSIVVPLIWLYNASQKIEINTKNNDLIKSHFFGILKKSFSLNGFDSFHVIRKSTYFIYTETTLAMVFRTKNKLNNVIISGMRNTVKLNKLKLEITSIINNS